MIKTVVRSMNGLRNDSFGVGADPGFRQLFEALSRIQRAGGVGFRVEARKDGSAAVVALRRGDADVGVGEDSRRVRELLGLEEGLDEFEVSYGVLPRSRGDVAMLTRSMLELLVELGFGVELPATHATDGRALPGRRQAGDAQATPLARIRSGTQPPADSYAAVPYKGHWYWIDDDDIASKSVFTFMLILSSLAETGQSVAAPIVTVPSR